MANCSRPAKQIVRDIESALAAELGISVDHKKISIAQSELPSPDDGQASLGVSTQGEQGRIKFVSVNVLSEGLKAHAQVDLARDGVSSIGTASGVNSQHSCLRLVAHATLNSISEFLDEDSTFSLRELREVDLAGTSTVLVCVDFVTSRSETSLVGCAINSNGSQQATVFATLDAVNRIFGRLKQKEKLEN
jgi:hypothetical protein